MISGLGRSPGKGKIPWKREDPLEKGRSPGGGNGYPLQYSDLENSMDRGAWQAIIHGVSKSQTRLNNFHSLTHSFKFRFNKNISDLRDKHFPWLRKLSQHSLSAVLHTYLHLWSTLHSVLYNALYF